MKKELFDELLESVQQMKEIQKGTRLPGRVTTPADLGLVVTPDAAAIRTRMNLSQSRFAQLLNISMRTLQGWEQGRREPEGPARVLLLVAARSPETLLALHAAPARPTTGSRPRAKKKK